MRILSIETSCDETAVSIVEAHGAFPHATYTILGNALFSQIDIHREYGGVFPMMAKRAHAHTLVPMLTDALEEANMLKKDSHTLDDTTQTNLARTLEREPDLAEALVTFLRNHTQPDFDLIAVTSGPGLEPALWVGVNFARALSNIWNIPLVPTNHMEGHVLASLFKDDRVADIQFPALALLISGGHTQLVRMNDWTTYALTGETRDDAVGEAFDKVARMLGLPYPGGPEISRRAAVAREKNLPEFARLPRPMLDSGDADFSFSGLKTAVKYAVQDKELSENETAAVARDFEDAVTDVLLAKTKWVAETQGIRTLILGGGVSANKHIRTTFEKYVATENQDLALYLPDVKLSTDNSIMIALAGHARMHEARAAGDTDDLRADGNRSLSL